MSKFTLSSEVRDVATKLSEIRAYGSEKKAQIPGVIYGHAVESTPITFDYSEFLKLYRETGKANVISLTVGKKKHDVLVGEVQMHPVTDRFIHVDFHALVAGETTHATIPLTYFGDSAAEKEGARIDYMIHEIEVKCLPKDLVSGFEIDIAKLATTGDVIHLADLGLDEKKFETTLPSDTTLAVAQVVRTQKVADEDEAPVADASTEEASAE